MKVKVRIKDIMDLNTDVLEKKRKEALIKENAIKITALGMVSCVSYYVGKRRGEDIQGEFVANLLLLFKDRSVKDLTSFLIGLAINSHK